MRAAGESLTDLAEPCDPDVPTSLTTVQQGSDSHLFSQVRSTCHRAFVCKEESWHWHGPRKHGHSAIIHLDSSGRNTTAEPTSPSKSKGKEVEADICIRETARQASASPKRSSPAPVRPSPVEPVLGLRHPPPCVQHLTRLQQMQEESEDDFSANMEVDTDATQQWCKPVGQAGCEEQEEDMPSTPVVQFLLMTGIKFMDKLTEEELKDKLEALEDLHTGVFTYVYSSLFQVTIPSKKNFNIIVAKVGIFHHSKQNMRYKDNFRKDLTVREQLLVLPRELRSVDAAEYQVASRIRRSSPWREATMSSFKVEAIGKGKQNC
ncbi:hypothetical protein HYPSUDRAFT_200548 [Hypholoma sublateritium FD-334 SS-4]|uniref:Uncharacterized protein n=1 Tax=Hypholoma sublateritium (strain FD-334 SS-4) TaxID=945553 RepID=A0A0D2P6N9_HYPSF|nr:hypothetical protein HYPSUDRAFT_200548 [Hypholoma sublateritium FD-334 SS-4]